MRNPEIQTKSYLDYFPSEREQLIPLLDHIESADRQTLFDRKNTPGHITASGIVLRGESLLMVRHPVLEKWLQPGGHVEAGETPIVAAKREVLEETGLTSSVHPWHHANRFPIDIDVHEIPKNGKKLEPTHLHFDFRYLLNTGPQAGMDGEHPASWFQISDLCEPNLIRLVKKIEMLRIAIN